MNTPSDMQPPRPTQFADRPVLRAGLARSKALLCYLAWCVVCFVLLDASIGWMGLLQRRGRAVSETAVYGGLWVMHLSAVAGYLTWRVLARRRRAGRRWAARHPAVTGWLVFLAAFAAGAAVQIAGVDRAPPPVTTAPSAHP